MNKRRLFSLLLALQLFAILAAGSAAAALLDVGPVVPEVNPSSAPTLGHGFPLWYRDTNRVPLQLCTDRDSGMCLTAEPFPQLTQSFPDNMGDELFWWAGEAAITVPQQGALDRDGDALLVMAIEAAFSTGDVVPGAQVSFARMRIRIDTPYAGEYLVSTPYKQFTFNVAADVVADGINHTEDIGLAEGGVFTGALKGSIGPFLYCSNAPIVVNGKSYLGNPGNDCAVSGSAFPSAENPTNYFRVQGPNGLDLRTDLFSIMGQLYTDPIPTPLEVDRVAYSRQSSGVRVHAFATTQAVANPTAGAAFPGNFALSGVPSVIEASGTGIPTVTAATNAPADGEFYGTSDLFADPGALPATVTVTNSADVPPTSRVVPLVDDVAIESAMFNPASNRLVVAARSYDRVAAPPLTVYMPGMTAPLGTMVNGRLGVTFPFTDNSVTPAKTYNIPPEKVTVVSALGGSDSAAVTGLSPFTALPTGTIAINGGAPLTRNTAATLTLFGTSPNGPVTQMQFAKDGDTFFGSEAYAPSRGVTLNSGDGAHSVSVRYIDTLGRISDPITASIILDTTAPTGTLTINDGAGVTNSATVALGISGGDANGVAQMQFSTDGVNYLAPVPYATSATLPLPSGDGLKTVWVRLIDAAGNVSAAVSANIILASTAPTGTVVINGGAAFTRSANATLTLSAGSTAGTVTQMQISKDGVNYFAYEPFALTRAVTLLPGEGVRSIYVRYKDNIGNVSAPASAGVVVDSTRPTGTIAFTTPDPTTTATGTLALSADDANGVTHMQFSKDGVNYFAWESFNTTRTVSLAPGLNTLYVRYRDSAGNISLTSSTTITRN